MSLPPVTVERSAQLPDFRTMYCALTPAGSNLKQDKVLLRKIRVQVLDCRSGKPVQYRHVDQVTLDGADAVRLLNTEGWDFVENYVIPANANGPLSWTGFGPTKKNPKASSLNLQKALAALGFLNAKPGKTMSEEAWSALEDYQMTWYQARKQTAPDKFTRAIEAVWVQRIVADYNEKFHRSVQVELTDLGYDCQSDDGQWGAASENALAKWQRVELAATNPLTTFNTATNLGARKKLAQKLREARKHFFTDEDGIVYIAVPFAKFQAGFKLTVTFHDFAMVLESSKCSRSYPKQTPTLFNVEWQDGAQDPAGNWCWRLRPRGNTDDRSSLPEFQCVVAMTVPPAPAGSCSWHDVAQSDQEAALFSPFYGNPWFEQLGDQPEYVAFALIWCQPVYDAIDDPSEPHNINHQAYIDPSFSLDVRASVRGLHMHVVTLGSQLSVHPHGGKGYGKIEAITSSSTQWRGEFNPSTGLHGHPGIDLYAPVGAKVFALHAGTAYCNTAKKPGQNVFVSWKSLKIQCLHFSAFMVSNGDFVKAGQVIGLAGRTGNFSDAYDPINAPTVAPPSHYPGHTHLNIGVHDYDSNLHQAIVKQDPDNAICLPTNNTPLVFPCVCEVTDPPPNDPGNPSNCQFANKTFTDTCWAVAELKCPFMFGAGRTAFRLQAQLRYVYEHQSAGDGYLNPGHVDGSLGNLPTGTNPHPSATRKAIRQFNANNSLADSYDLDDDGWALLDQLAVIEEPES